MSAEALAALLSNSDDGFVVARFGEGATEHRWNAAAARLHEGYAPDDEGLADAVALRDEREQRVPHEAWPIVRFLRGEPVPPVVLSLYRAGSRTPVRALRYRSIDASPGLRMLQVEDVSHREDRVRSAERAARTAEADLDGFVGAMVHDLRAPLRAICTFSEDLRRLPEEQLAGEARELAGDVAAAGVELGELLEGLTRLVRTAQQSLVPEAVDVSALAAEIDGDLRRRSPARTVTTLVEPSLCLRGDARLLETVIEELLGNAWKFTAPRADATIRLESRKREGKTFVCVVDDGVGFSMGQVTRLFRPFQRLHRPADFPGRGMGLATVLRIVRKHHGDVFAESTASETVFGFHVPAPPEAG